MYIGHPLSPRAPPQPPSLLNRGPRHTHQGTWCLVPRTNINSPRPPFPQLLLFAFRMRSPRTPGAPWGFSHPPPAAFLCCSSDFPLSSLPPCQGHVSCFPHPGASVYTRLALCLRLMKSDDFSKACEPPRFGFSCSLPI